MATKKKTVAPTKSSSPRGGKEAFLHRCFEEAFKEHFGKVFSSEDIQKIILARFPDFKKKSIIPYDHAGRKKPKEQCGQCSENEHQIFDTLVEGHKKHHAHRYRVRMFEPYQDQE